MNKDIYVIGAGPRGLAVCLYALHKGLNVTLIDPAPYSQWQVPNILPDLEMRSPITFDLVTYLPELRGYSLSAFLGSGEEKTETQAEAELNQIKVQRSDFFKYLEFCFEVIRPQVRFIRERVNLIESDRLWIGNSYLETRGSPVVIASGCTEIKLPDWLKQTHLKERIISIRELILQEVKGCPISVIGSGQAAAEATHYLADKGNHLTWVLSRKPKVNQYPGPSYQEWGIRSALGDFYSRLDNWNDRINYLGAVKKFQPTITPYIQDRLRSISYQEIIPTSSWNPVDIVEPSCFILPLTGFFPNLDRLPIKGRVERNPYLPQFPVLTKGFQIKGTSLYVTGLLATAFDGPRQSSLVSAGLTAKAIVDELIGYSI